MNTEPITTDEYTDRYLEEATRTLPAHQRDDYANELRSSIHDQIDDRIENGEEPAAAERAVLNGLGDPAVLAASYVGQPLHLIGPRWYPTWRRIIRIILWSALPAVAFAVAIGFALEGRPFWGIVGSVLGITLTVGAWIFTITTLSYSKLDRANVPVGPWTVSALPTREPNEGRPSSRAERVVGVVAVAIAVIGLAFVSIPWSVLNAGRMSVLDAALWPWDLIVGIVLIGIGALVTARARASGHWTIGSAVLNAVIATVWAALVIGLTVIGRLFDASFVEFIRIDLDAQRVVAVCLVAGTIVLAAWSAVDGFRRALRFRSTRHG